MPIFKTKEEQIQYDKTLQLMKNTSGTGNQIDSLGSVVPYLSTESAANKVNQGLNKLNQITSPQTPVIKDETKTSNNTTSTTAITPKIAKFVNDAGQVITFTEQDLKNRNNINMLKDGGYVFSEGEFVPDLVGQQGTGYYSVSNGRRRWNDTTGFGGNRVDNPLQQAFDQANNEFDKAYQDFISYNVNNDPAFQSIASGITAQYDALRNQMQKTNESRMKAFESAGLRGGTAEFAGSVQRSIEGGELTQANERIAELTRQEMQAISSARAAYETGKYDQFNKQLSILEKRREEKLNELKKYNDTLATEINKQREIEIQSSRDSAISGLLQQGITDPTQMLEMLNFDESGKKIGDFTLQEIGKSLDSVAKYTNSNIEKLTGDTKNFFLLKNMSGALPASITSLPENQQLGAYLRWIKAVEKGGSVTPSGTITNINKGIITPDEISKLPVSTLTKAVMSGMGKVKDLTPTQKAEVLSEMYQVGYNPQTYVLNKLSNLVELYASIPENSRGWVEGSYFWQSKTIPEVAAFESAKSILTREIARLNDVGVLSDQDVSTYDDAMPSRRDQDLSVVVNKISGLASTITQKKAENVGRMIEITEGKYAGKTAIVSFDGETLLDPVTGEELQ